MAHLGVFFFFQNDGRCKLKLLTASSLKWSRCKIYLVAFSSIVATFPSKTFMPEAHTITLTCVCMPEFASVSSQRYQVWTGRWAPRLCLRVTVKGKNSDTVTYFCCLAHMWQWTLHSVWFRYDINATSMIGICLYYSTCGGHRKQQSGAKVIHTSGGQEGQGN